MPSLTPSALSCDIFCRVVDNFGDAGVCWRLAQQLASEHGWAIRLWIDDLASLKKIAPAANGRDVQNLAGLEVRRWGSSIPADVRPHPVVIEAFACSLPQEWVRRMRALPAAPAWLNLEYLSAEAWVEGCHALPSVDPASGLTKHFFFPGFTPATGGLLKERTLDAARAAFASEPGAIARFFQRVAPSSVPEDALRLSMFCYAGAPLPGLCEALAGGTVPACLFIPEGQPLEALGGWAGAPLSPGQSVRRGPLTLIALPFLAGEDYDRLLWACDFNFVRGEDSFVRAQWARQPFAWHIYPQDEDAHWPKLEAFADRYLANAPLPLAGVWRNFQHAWNGRGAVSEAWPALAAHWPEARRHAVDWAETLDLNGKLAEKLATFCSALLESRALSGR